MCYFAITKVVLDLFAFNKMLFHQSLSSLNISENEILLTCRCKSETLGTLRFAQRAKAIKNKAVVNEITQDDVNVLREQIRQLKVWTKVHILLLIKFHYIKYSMIFYIYIYLHICLCKIWIFIHTLGGAVSVFVKISSISGIIHFMVESWLLLEKSF